MSKEKEVQYFSFQDVFDKEVECARDEELFRYFQGISDLHEREAFEEHLKVCHTCAQHLIELQDSEDAIHNVSLDQQKSRQIFDENRIKLRARLDLKNANQIEQSADVPRKSIFQFAPYISALMLLTIAILIYPAYRGLVLNNDVNRLQQELAAKETSGQDIATLKEHYKNEIRSLSTQKQTSLTPEIATSTVYSVRSERAAELETIPVSFVDQQTDFNLVFAMPGTEFESYRLEILKNGRSIWQSDASRPSQNLLISVQLHRNYFDANGQYSLQIRGKKAGSMVMLAEYRLKIISGEPEATSPQRK